MKNLIQELVRRTRGRGIYIFNRGDGIDHLDDLRAEHNILRFGAGIDPSSIKLHLGSLLLDLGPASTGAEPDQIHLEGFDQRDVYNSSVIDSFEFADGTVQMRWGVRSAANDASDAARFEWRVAA